MSLTYEQKNKNILSRFESNNGSFKTTKITAQVGTSRMTVLSMDGKSRCEIINMLKKKWPNEYVTEI